MGKYIIEVGDAYTEYICGKGDMLCLPVRINEFEDNWLNTNIPLTPYTEPDTEKVREEAYEDGYKTAKVQYNIQAEKDLREVGERHYQKGYQDATVKISSDEHAIAEKAYQCGLKDAWEAARKISSIIDPAIRDEIFDRVITSDIFDENTTSEAIEKIRQYEQEQEEIKVGDEVIAPLGVAVITEITDECFHFIHADGSYGFDYKRDAPRKTGRHFPEIAAVLAKMKEES